MNAIIRHSNLMATLLGAQTRQVIHMAWSLVVFQANIMKKLPHVVLNFHFTVEQMYVIGITSIPLVAMTSVFTGGVSAYQMAYQFADLVPDLYIGVAVGKSVLIELGPILTALVMAGRIGAAMCAELATMAVTEQLDAMRCLNLNPYRYLLAPRVLAGIIMLPVLTVLSSFVAILGAYGVSYVVKGLDIEIFFKGVKLFYSDWDLIVGLIKSVVFGYIIATFACFFGYFTSNGAEGVGAATKASVVFSMTSILISGFLISKLLL
jgi:phospholipid/cholesterol/gamma-HCH transport system permease protein